MTKSLGALPGVKRVRPEELAEGWWRFEVDLQDLGDPREEIFRLATREQWSLRHLSLEAAKLEEIFAGLTTTPEEGWN